MLEWYKVALVLVGIYFLFVRVFKFQAVLQSAIFTIRAALFIFQFIRLKIAKYSVIECHNCIVAFGALYCYGTHSVISSLFVKNIGVYSPSPHCPKQDDRFCVNLGNLYSRFTIS